MFGEQGHIEEEYLMSEYSEERKNILEDLAQRWATELVEMSKDELGCWDHLVGEELLEEEWEWIKDNIAFYTDAIRKD